MGTAAVYAPPPLACIADAIPASERAMRRALVARLFATGARDRRAAPGGYEYRFDAAALDDVAPDDAPLRLRITRPERTRELLDAELHAGRRIADADGPS